MVMPDGRGQKLVKVKKKKKKKLPPLAPDWYFCTTYWRSFELNQVLTFL